MSPLDPQPAALLSLPEGEVHVWMVEPEAITEAPLLERYRALLDAGERERHLRFRFEKHRKQFLVSHALVRVVLSHYASRAPEAWSFERSEFGRPEASGEGSQGLRFNLSHTDGMALCAVTRAADLGADVEDESRSGETVRLAHDFFAAAEVAALRALPESLQRARFFELWTLKEAYLKARGAGLSLPLQQFAFALEPGTMPRISFDPRLEDTPADWQFLPFQASPRHPAALAVRRRRDLPLSVRCWRTVPLVREEEVAPLDLSFRPTAPSPCAG
ncbi:4'-phosphopantetheinyl transferase superfamily protein [Myxococcaceae bacterium GXIMD 01537]